MSKNTNVAISSLLTLQESDPLESAKLTFIKNQFPKVGGKKTLISIKKPGPLVKNDHLSPVDSQKFIKTRNEMARDIMIEYSTYDSSTKRRNIYPAEVF
jgi:hypothetical protein